MISIVPALVEVEDFIAEYFRVNVNVVNNNNSTKYTILMGL